MSMTMIVMNKEVDNDKSADRTTADPVANLLFVECLERINTIILPTEEASRRVLATNK